MLYNVFIVSQKYVKVDSAAFASTTFLMYAYFYDVHKYSCFYNTYNTYSIYIDTSFSYNTMSWCPEIRSTSLKLVHIHNIDNPKHLFFQSGHFDIFF